MPHPCRTCGYLVESEPCALCANATREPSLAGAPARGLARLWTGFRALGHGLRILAVTPRTKRLLVPPFLISLATFALVFAWSWSRVHAALQALDSGLGERLEDLPALLRPVIGWLVHSGVLLVSAQLVAFLAFGLLASLVFLWTFSVLYEAFAGPFLDALQGRLEARWFGRDPRAVLEAARPGGGIGRRVGREFANWWTSIKASLLALLVLLGFLWLKFLPVVGLPLFAMVAGFATSLTLLDIPFSRRGWSLAQRLEFLRAHLPEVLSLGFASALAFLPPLIGPLVAVPAASVGGLWLLVRLDKSVVPAGKAPR